MIKVLELSVILVVWFFAFYYYTVEVLKSVKTNFAQIMHTLVAIVSGAGIADIAFKIVY